MSTITAFEQKFLALREVELNKNQLIEDLLIHVKQLEATLTDERLHLEREQESTKSFQTKLHNALLVTKRKEQEIDANSFLSVLLDGDCMLFLDHFIISAEKGGMDAARYVRTAVREYISSALKELHLNIQIRVRVYANAKGLASAYCHSNILDDASDLFLFMRGFNMGDPWSDFVDAGDGKECADSKLKACFDHDLADVHCKAVLFGGSADNGYARLLLPFAGDEAKRNRIILIEGPPFVKELASLSGQFLVTRFPKVFRDNAQLSPRLTSAPVAMPSPPVIINAATYAASIAFLTASMPSASVRSSRTRTAKSSLPPLPINSTSLLIPTPSIALMATTPSFTPTPAPSATPVIVINAKNQRLDTNLNPSKQVLKAMRSRKLCNSFHILGECDFKACEYEHGTRLDEAGIEARRWIARQAVCPQGFACRDAKCLLGHQCPSGRCSKVGNGCKFKREMHNVSRKLTNVAP